MHKKLQAALLFLPALFLYGVWGMFGGISTSLIGAVITMGTGFLWYISSLKNTYLHLYHWQRCEYRLDRFRDFLTTSAGKKYLYNRSTFFYALLLLHVVFLIATWQAQGTVAVTMLIGTSLFLLVYQVLDSILWLKKQGWYLPQMTMKVMLLAIAQSTIEVILMSVLPFVGIFVVEIGRGILIALLLFVMKPLQYFYKKRILLQAQHRLETFGFHHRIALVGAFGKTTVKEFLYHLLQKRFGVVVTPRRVNTEIGIAQMVCAMEYNGEEILLCEMGGYKKGEVAVSAQMVKPDIAILTGVGNQHAALYGSAEAVLEGDFEALRSLPAHGRAYVPAGIHYPESLLQMLQAEVIRVGESYSFEVKSFETQERGSTCVVLYNGEEYVMTLPFWGRHQMSNLFLAITTALDLGMSMEELLPRCSNISLPEGSLAVHRGSKGALYIDDTYNCNVEGFKAALQVLKDLPGTRKIVITQGVLELGTLHEKEHRKIGGECSLVADIVVVTREDAVEPIRYGMGGKGELYVALTYPELLTWCQQNIQQSDTVLLANRLPGNLRSILLPSSL